MTLHARSVGRGASAMVRERGIKTRAVQKDMPASIKWDGGHKPRLGLTFSQHLPSHWCLPMAGAIHLMVRHQRQETGRFMLLRRRVAVFVPTHCTSYVIVTSTRKPRALLGPLAPAPAHWQRALLLAQRAWATSPRIKATGIPSWKD